MADAADLKSAAP